MCQKYTESLDVQFIRLSCEMLLNNCVECSASHNGRNNKSIVKICDYGVKICLLKINQQCQHVIVTVTL